MYELAPDYRHKLWEAIENEPDKVEADIRRRCKNHVFSCMFIKRTNRHLRHMVARLNVRYTNDNEKGLHRDWNPSDHKLMQVYDMQKGAFRFINLPKVLWVKARGDLIVYNQEVVLKHPKIVPVDYE